MMRTVEKVVIYITRSDQLLVFIHPNFPEAGLQVPAGTIEPGEAPIAAARREATEETGLAGFTDWTFLGMRERDMRDFGRDERHRRFFFHARYDASEISERWRWSERFSADGGEEIVFEFFWMPFQSMATDLAGNQGDLLDKLPTER